MDQEDQGDHNPPWWTRTGFYILLMYYPYDQDIGILQASDYLRACGWLLAGPVWIGGLVNMLGGVNLGLDSCERLQQYLDMGFRYFE